MFQFPWFPLPVLCVQTGVTPHDRVPGFPIRTSTDQRLVGSSPWLIAATHVLHRCQTPRHPPLALCSLEEQRCSCSLCSSQGASGRAVCSTPEMRTPARPRGSRRRRLEERWRRIATPSKQKTGQSVENRARPSGGSTCDRRCRLGLDRARLQLGVVPAVCRNNDSLERR